MSAARAQPFRAGANRRNLPSQDARGAENPGGMASGRRADAQKQEDALIFAAVLAAPGRKNRDVV